MSDQTYSITTEEQVVIPKGDILSKLDPATGEVTLWQKFATLKAQDLAGAVQAGAATNTTSAAVAGGIDASSLASLVAGLVQSKSTPEGITGLLSALPVIGPLIVPALKMVGINLGDLGGVLQQGMGFITDLVGSGVASTDEEKELKSLMDQIETELAKAS